MTYLIQSWDQITLLQAVYFEWQIMHEYHILFLHDHMISQPQSVHHTNGLVWLTSRSLHWYFVVQQQESSPSCLIVAWKLINSSSRELRVFTSTILFVLKSKFSANTANFEWKLLIRCGWIPTKKLKLIVISNNCTYYHFHKNWRVQKISVLCSR